MRHLFYGASAVTVIGTAVASVYYPPFLMSAIVSGPLLIMGFRDVMQKKQTIRRNFPVLGRMRYLFELIRPEINQYFVESNSDGVPFSREQRSVVYQRSKLQMDTLPFGTQKDVYETGYEWVNQSLAPTHLNPEDLKVKIGSSQCSKPYEASLLNISAMSYGSLSKNAIMALNGGAYDNGFAHNTGEGGLSPYHLSPGGDIIWQIGTGYFGCRKADGTFDPIQFEEKAKNPQVKMIEIKISQGAKPGHGGILPGSKVNSEIADIRGVPEGKDVLSPPTHSSFSNPAELMNFVKQLRELSGGKPIGFKICLGKRREFLAICKAILELKIFPDFIAVDGGEGGTGAAPIEFSNHIGTPGIEALILVHNALKGIGVRDEVKIIASGKITTSFGIIKRLALGADITYSARGMMLALGCIQALRCNANVCPAGVATTDPELYKGLDIQNKRERVANFHRETIKSCAEMLGAMGLDHSSELRPWHIMRRVAPNKVFNYSELYDYVEDGDLLTDSIPQEYARAFKSASSQTFRHSETVNS